MKSWLLGCLLILSACSEELLSPELSSPEPSKQILPWQPLETVSIDSFTGDTPPVELPLSAEQFRRALRVTTEPGNCVQVSSAIDQFGAELSHAFIRNPCPDCLWRTSVIHGRGLLVLEGSASNLASIGFSRVDCDTLSISPADGTVDIELLETGLPEQSGIALRLLTSRTIDSNALRQAIEAELGFQVTIDTVLEIEDTELLLQSPTDTRSLELLLDTLPAKNEATIDLVIGPCLIRDSVFGQTRLAGFTPRIPGGAGTADAVFVSRRSCGFRNEIPDDINTLAHIAAHELGHYLGLLHPEETDGTVDDLPSTNTHNLMHQQPLIASSIGLTGEQIARMRAHPFVQNLISER